MATINSLPSVTLPVLDTDELALSRGANTRKVTVPNLLAGKMDDFSKMDDLPSTLQGTDVIPVGRGSGAYKATVEELKPTSVQLQIPTGQWSGSGPYTYTVSATNVTASTVISAEMDDSSAYLTDDLSITTGAGTITLSTSTLPTGTINVTIHFEGVTGDVEVQVLADVYSKSQTDTLIAQSTANDLGQLNSAVLDAEGTVQIPNVASMANGVLVLVVRRWGYIATKAVPVRLFKHYDVTQHLIFRDTSAANSITELSISQSGLITCISTTNPVILDAVYIP